MTKDMAGLSFSPAFVDAAIAGCDSTPWRAWGMTRLKVGEEASCEAVL